MLFRSRRVLFRSDPNHIVELEPVQARKDLTYEEYSIRIVDRKEQILRRRNISYVKVQWSRHSEREATWELEEEMKQKYPQLFETTGMKNFEDKISFRGEECYSPSPSSKIQAQEKKKRK